MSLLQRTCDLLADMTGSDVTIDTARLTDAREYSGECYQVYATIGDAHVEDWYCVEYADLYEAEGRGSYHRVLANELLRRYRNAHHAAPAVHDDEDEMTETETETI